MKITKEEIEKLSIPECLQLLQMSAKIKIELEE